MAAERVGRAYDSMASRTAAASSPRELEAKDPESLIPGCSSCLPSATSREWSSRLFLLLGLTILLAGCSGVALSCQFGLCGRACSLHREVGSPALIEKTPTTTSRDKFSAEFFHNLERASGAIAGWLNLVPLGQCRAYANSFAEHGLFVFQAGQQQYNCTTREEVYKFCLKIAPRIKATRLISNFIEEDGNTIVGLVEEFVQDAPGRPLSKHRAGVTFKTKMDPTTGYRMIQQYFIVMEERYEALKEHVKDIIQASLERRRSFSCNRWKDVLNNKDVEVRIQGNHSLDKHGAAEALAHCQEFAYVERQATLIHYADVEAVFPTEQMVMIFFKVESLRRGMLIFEDHPEALVLWMARDSTTGVVLPEVRVLHDFLFESMNMVASWYSANGVRDRQNLEAAGAAVVTAAGSGKRVSVVEL